MVGACGFLRIVRHSLLNITNVSARIGSQGTIAITKLTAAPVLSPKV